MGVSISKPCVDIVYTFKYAYSPGWSCLGAQFMYGYEERYSIHYLFDFSGFITYSI